MKQIILPLILIALAFTASAQTTLYTPPPSPRAKINFDSNWKFIRDDVPGAEAPAFDDSTWTTVSTPHTFNDVDSFREIISHSGGDRGTYKGLVLVPQAFQASRQARRQSHLPGIRGHAAGGRHLPQRQAGRTL